MPHRLTLRQMRDRVASGALSAAALVEAHLATIARDNPRLNAFTEFDAARARAAARTPRPGPLSGVPLTIKASVAWDATVATRLIDAGAILIGRTNVPPFLMNYETDNHETGRTSNPHDVSLTSGGSSGGEAAAIAACLSAGGIGSDGGGSIRWPAHCCRIAGLKPTPGRVPATGHVPECVHPGGLLGVVGPMARNCDDLRLLFEVVAGHDAADPFSAPVPVLPPPVSWPSVSVVDVWPLDAPIRARLESAARVVDARPWDDARLTGLLDRAHDLWRFFFWRVNWLAVKPLVEGREDTLHPLALEWFRAEDVEPGPSAGELLDGLAARDRLRAEMLALMDEHPVLLLAPATIEPFAHGDRRRFSLDCVRPLSVANVLGLPALVTNTGVQLVGRPWEEETLLAIGHHLETRAVTRRHADVEESRP